MKSVKTLQAQFDAQADMLRQIKTQLEDTQRKLAKEVTANERLRSMAERRAAQIARRDKVMNDNQLWFENFKLVRSADFMETAISIINWNELPEIDKWLTSKRIELMIARFGKVVLFYWEKKFLVLPFTGVGGSLNEYTEFEIVKPYSPAGQMILPDNLIVGKDCVILYDFMRESITNCNNSLTIELAIQMYVDLIAECEIAKKINRNWIKLPILFRPDDVTDRNKFSRMVEGVNDIILGISDYANAMLTEYADNIEILDTKTVYFGEELQQTIRDYENDLYNFLGIGHIKNETRARKITAEFEKTSDEYNINIKKRLLNRQQALDDAKKLWTEFEPVTLSVNLDAYNSVEFDEGVKNANSEQPVSQSEYPGN